MGQLADLDDAPAVAPAIRLEERGIAAVRRDRRSAIGWPIWAGSGDLAGGNPFVFDAEPQALIGLGERDGIGDAVEQAQTDVLGRAVVARKRDGPSAVAVTTSPGQLATRLDRMSTPVIVMRPEPGCAVAYVAQNAARSWR